MIITDNKINGNKKEGKCSDYGKAYHKGRLFLRKEIEVYQDRILILFSLYLVGRLRINELKKRKLII